MNAGLLSDNLWLSSREGLFNGEIPVMPPDNLHQNIVEFLRHSRELGNFCTQNGWIDDDSVEYEVLEDWSDWSDWSLIGVRFTEIVMEGSGCVADRVSCYGRLRLRFDNNGYVETAIID